jgi:hypothetical protein
MERSVAALKSSGYNLWEKVDKVAVEGCLATGSHIAKSLGFSTNMYGMHSEGDKKFWIFRQIGACTRYK